jgi:RNA polymerase sigma-70 factor (ECF subfamily)
MTRLRPALVARLPRPTNEHQPALDDAEILGAIKNGDASAATALYHRAHGQIERTLRRILGRRDQEHEDFVQLAFVELVRSVPRFRGECSLETWIARVTARVLFSQLRRRSSRERLFASASDPDVVDEATDGERAANARSLARRIRHHLDAIDPRKAWTVVLHDVCGYDLREIAEITRCSISAAQTRLFRGRIELRQTIDKDPELADELRRGEGHR